MTAVFCEHKVSSQPSAGGEGQAMVGFPRGARCPGGAEWGPPASGRNFANCPLLCQHPAPSTCPHAEGGLNHSEEQVKERDSRSGDLITQGGLIVNNTTIASELQL